ncbi:hypothetical protein [uncultured Sneathia sp.]|nr:hypothetical protein [uncultured Sneathia sp.]
MLKEDKKGTKNDIKIMIIYPIMLNIIEIITEKELKSNRPIFKTKE